MIRWSKILAIGLVVYSTAAIALMFGSGRVGVVADDIYFIPAVTGTLVGAFLAIKRPDNRMGPLMAIMAAALVTLGATNVLVPWALEQERDTLVVVGVHLSDLAWVTQFVAALVLLPLWFPTGRPINRPWSWVGGVAIGAAAVAEVSFFVSESVCAFESMLAETCINVQVPWGIDGFAGFEPLLLVTFVMALAAVVSTFVRWRQSDDVERHQIKWFFVAAVALLIAFVVSFLDFSLTLSNVVFAMALTAVWASIAIAVLKYRLYDIDRIISRTVSYAVVVALLLGAVAAVAAVVGTRFSEPLVVAGTTLAVAALFNPLRRRVQGWVDRYFNRSAYDTEQVMDRFAGSLRDEVDADEVVEGWVEVVEETMQPSSMGVWVRE